jgi:putative membrane protein
MMGFYGPGMGTGVWLLMGAFWIAVVALVIWLLARIPGRTGRGDSPPEAPLDILDRRFARGEIDRETYLADRATLTGTRT